jgi:pimeloyl-ACP methyl ester carboxylesterase
MLVNSEAACVVLKGSYHKLTDFHEVDKGGHCAAWEQPKLFSEEIRAPFRSLR